ncbi:MAG: membrane dipeptidase [Clostridia bacterium]|nr:membrane dipeptidase [Clostridia bacterium]
MQRLRLIDTHCDTAFELWHRGEEIEKNSCHIDFEKAREYTNYTQFFAIWANKRRTDDEAFDDFLKVSDNFIKQINTYCDKISSVKTFEEMNAAWNNNKTAAFLAVEDARILGGRIERLDVLKERGVKYLTMMWGGETCIGSSHDVDGGLTDFGRAVVHKCFEYGIIPDISHSNEQTTEEISQLAFEHKKPFIASHSNCYSLFPHTRNLREKHLNDIIKLGGIVGISLCPYHIKDMSDGICTVSDVVAHIEKYLELGAENVLGLGCDLDGTDLPQGFNGVNDLYKIADELARINYSNELIEKIFYKNFYEFIKKVFN